MGYEVKQYKLTEADAQAINGSRPSNWYQRVKAGDEHPMIIMGKVLLDGETSYWVNPSAPNPPPVPAASPVPVAQVQVAEPVKSVPSPAAAPQVQQAQPAALTPEQHAVLAAAGVPASGVSH